MQDSCSRKRSQGHRKGRYLPLAVWAARLYLERFQYRVENYGWVFVAAVVIGVVIAFATVLWQTAKAAQADPAVELKKE